MEPHSHVPALGSVATAVLLPGGKGAMMEFPHGQLRELMTEFEQEMPDGPPADRNCRDLHRHVRAFIIALLEDDHDERDSGLACVAALWAAVNAPGHDHHFSRIDQVMEEHGKCFVTIAVNADGLVAACAEAYYGDDLILELPGDALENAPPAGSA